VSTMTRTDIHRPSAPEFDPENYVCFGFADFHPSDGQRPVQIVSALVDEGWSFRGAPHGSGQCSHCGTRLRYAALMGHEPTKTLLYVGETCLGNRFDGTASEFQALRAAAAAKAEQSRREGKSAAFLAEHPEAVYLSYAHNIDVAGGTVEWTTAYSYGEHTFDTQEEAQTWIDGLPGYQSTADYPIKGYKRGTTWGERTRFSKTPTMSDIWYKIERYGEVSEKSLDYALKIMEWADQAEQRLVAREAEAAAKVAAGVKVPEGRVVIEGEVTTTKFVDNQFGGSLKMRVVSPEGWAVWGTVPSSIDVEKGDTVRFTAKIEASNDDPTFGFYSRPTKASKI
jgi:plastocyanin